MEHEVFISYSSKNKNAAVAICHILEENEIKCWMAPRDIPPGAEYGDLIDEAIKASKVVVVVFSQNAADSKWVKGELNIAFEEQKVIIPYRIDSTPFSGQHRVILNQRHWIDAYPDFQTKFKDLVNAVLAALNRPFGNKSQEGTVDLSSSSTLSKRFYKIICCVIFGIAIIFAFFVIGNTDSYKEQTSLFSYNKDGLKISNISGLSDKQKVALVSILDNMVFVEGGDFYMGNDINYQEYLTGLDSLSSNTHKVSLSQFYISKYEVTQSQWKAFTILTGCSLEPNDKKAIDNISWEEAKSFADNLSIITGLKFSLPTEAQWEYAASYKGDGTKFPFAGFEDGIHHYAWTIADNLSCAEAVGQKLPNKLGLYDMTGNVSEWCLDDYAIYTTGNVVNPIVFVGNNKKIFRGGDFRTPNTMDMKVTSRYYAPSFAKREGNGLRLVINL